MHFVLRATKSLLPLAGRYHGRVSWIKNTWSNNPNTRIYPAIDQILNYSLKIVIVYGHLSCLHSFVTDSVIHQRLGKLRVLVAGLTNCFCISSNLCWIALTSDWLALVFLVVSLRSCAKFSSFSSNFIKLENIFDAPFDGEGSAPIGFFQICRSLPFWFQTYIPDRAIQWSWQRDPHEAPTMAILWRMSLIPAQ